MNRSLRPIPADLNALGVRGLYSPVVANDYDDIIESFLADDGSKGKSSERIYAGQLRRFFSWVDNSGRQLQSLLLADLNAYKSELSAGHSPLTVAGAVNTLRCFYRWASSQGLCLDIAAGLKSPRREQSFQREPLTLTEVRDLVHTGRDGSSLRDYAIVNLMVRTGLRTVEIVRADIGDISRKGGVWLLRIQGKGHTAKDNFVVLDEACYRPIREYLDTRTDNGPDSPLFTSESDRNRSGRLTTRTISGIAKKGLRAIGLDDRRYTAHSLRHTAATRLLREGSGTMEDARLMLRHANVETTRIYAHTIAEEERVEHGGELMLGRLYAAAGI